MKKNKTPYKLLQTLVDGSFHSGEKLGNQLGMTRSAIWKAIQQLTAQGIEIQSVTGRGYRIPRGLTLLNTEIIKTHLDTKAKSQLDEIILLDSIDSTNNYLLDLIKQHPKQRIVCLAEQQTQGRGRSGKQWISPFGTNIYQSIAWHFEKDAYELSGLSLAIAVATVRALQAFGVNDLTLKWPNDVLYGQKKVSGILLDLVAEIHQHCTVIIGIGINTRMTPHQSQNIDQAWTAIEDITQKPADRNLLASCLINEVITALQQFEQFGLSAFMDEWRTFDAFIGKEVSLHQSDKTIKGVIEGISEKGELLLRHKNGELVQYLSGDVARLRKSSLSN